MDESDSKTRVAADAAEEPSRRNLLVGLLGIAAGGTALRVLSGCAPGGASSVDRSDGSVGVSEQALTGTPIGWVDTVLGTAPPNPRTGDLATLDASGVGARLAIAKGCLRPGDGGGGIFFWEVGDTSGDDGGTIIVPTTTNGRWRRIYSGAVDVKWFGAQPVAHEGIAGDAALAASNSAAIQAAIDSIKLVGGTVFFPIGTYWVSRPIRLTQAASQADPAYWAYSNITLEGAGSSYAVPDTGAPDHPLPSLPVQPWPCSQIKAFVPILAGDTLGILGFFGHGVYALRNVGIRKLRISGYDEVTPAGPLVGFVGTSGSFMIDCYIDRTPHEGAYWNGPGDCENVLITGNYATLIGGWGNPNPGWTLSAYNVAAKNVTLTNNRSYKCGAAIEQEGSGIFANNIFEYCGKADPLTSRGQWTAAMVMQSSRRYGKIIIQGNIVRCAGNGIGVNWGCGETIIADNYFDACGGGIQINPVPPNVPPVGEEDVDPGTPFVIRGNYFYDTIGTPPSQASAIYHGGGGSSHAPASIIENNTIVLGPTAPWAYAIYVNDLSAGDIVRNNVVFGIATTGPVFYALQAANTAVQFIDNVVIPNGMVDDFPRYYWRGVLYTKTMFAGIDDGMVLSTLRPSLGRRAEALGHPTAGAWTAGDSVTNATPHELSPGGVGQPKYVIEGWVCVAGGTPGTWVERRVLTGNLSP